MDLSAVVVYVYLSMCNASTISLGDAITKQSRESFLKSRHVCTMSSDVRGIWF